MKKSNLRLFYPQKVKRHLFCALMACATCSIPANAFTQATFISLSKSNVSMHSVMEEIEKLSDYTFFYNDNQIKLDKKISVNAKNASIEQVLNQMFKDSGYTYKIVNNQILISTVKAVNVIEHQQQKSRTITGCVKDVNGEPIIGASVVEKGVATNGTVTDFEGNYTLTISSDELQISYIGYLPQVVKVHSGTSFYNVTLKEDTKTLDEVVVIGYGTQKKVNLTGSVASVSSSEIKDRVQTNVLSAVQGTVPGVTVISRPGSTPSINFRGRGNLGTSEPLYVIDGAIADAAFFQSLNPNSIESISFLKDASSSAIYGSRAAYGVVLVTTKNGEKGKMNVSYSGLVGMKTPTYLPKTVDSWEYASMLNDGMYNRNAANGKYQAYSQEEIDKFRNGTDLDYYPNTNWADLVLDKHVLTTQHSVSFSGGSDKVRYFMNLGYMYDDKPNFMSGQDKTRYTLDTNIASDITKWFTVKGSIKYIRNVSDTEHGQPWMGNFLLVPSIMVAQQSNGEWGSIAGGKQATQSFITGNPLRALSNKNWSKSKTEETMYDLGFDIKPVKGLVISGQGVFRGQEYKGKSYTALQDEVKTFETGTPIGGTGTYTNSMSMNWSSVTRMLYTGTIKYDWSNSIHNITALAGTSYEHYKYEALSAGRKNFPSDALEDLNGGSNAGKDLSNGGGMTEYKILSYFGRINYSLMDRYLLEANIRADASSRFYKDNRWGYFPSFSAGWRISQEEFMKNISWINNLKIRASWGTLGNINNVGNYDYFQNYNLGSDYNFNDEAVKGILESKPANLGLGWETVALTDFGVDIDLFDNKLSIVADYYIKNTSDILLGYNVPVETGIWSAPSQNIGKVKNTGFEMALTYRGNVGDLKYTVTGNIATNKNKVVDLAGSDDIISNGGDKIRFILREGEPIGSFYGYKTDGLYTQEEIDAGRFYTFGRIPNAGDIKYVPQREDVKYYGDLEANEDKSHAAISGEDRTIIGKDVPDFTYGVNLNLQWKNFELSVFGQGVSGTMTAFESEQISAFMLNANPREFHRGRWTQENPNPRAIYPRIYGGHSLDDYNQYFSDYQLFDSDYFRIKSISLGYMVPINVVKSWGLSSLKLFVTGENLFTLRADDKMKDFDPESPSGRGLSYLGSKSVAFGVNVSF